MEAADTVDGYHAGSPDKFHINWGYSGKYNDYFFLDSLTPGTHNYNSFHKALFGIQPAPACSPVNISAVQVGSGGVHRIGNNGTVTVNNSTINSGGTGVYYSGTSVRLLPGFHAKSGSRIHAAIQHFPCDGVAPRSISAGHLYGEEEPSEWQEVSVPATGLSVFPNPATDLLHVRSAKEIEQMELRGLSGEKVMESRVAPVDLRSLLPGMYILSIRFTDGSARSEKIVKRN